MLTQAEIRVGDKVHYQPDHYAPDEWENGMVKEVPAHTEDYVRVVYNCNNEWEDHRIYTSALTKVENLHKGWRKKNDNSNL